MEAPYPMSAGRYVASLISAAAFCLLPLACGSSQSQPGGTGGSATGGGSSATGGTGGGSAVACSSALSDRVRISEIDVGATYAYNEVDNNGAALGLTPLAISPIPGGGSRLAFLEKGASDDPRRDARRE